MQCDPSLQKLLATWSSNINKHNCILVPISRSRKLNNVHSNPIKSSTYWNRCQWRFLSISWILGSIGNTSLTPSKCPSSSQATNSVYSAHYESLFHADVHQTLHCELHQKSSVYSWQEQLVLVSCPSLESIKLLP